VQITSAPPGAGATPSTGAPESAAATPDEIRHGRSVYNRACVMCHGPNGAGGIANGPPPLKGPGNRVGDFAATQRLIASGSTNMAPMAGLLTADEIDDVAKLTVAGFPAE